MVGGACEAPPADVVVPADGDPSTEPAFADVVLAVTQGGSLMTCDDFRGCPAAGSCTQSPVVGPPDGDVLALPSAGVLEVGFTCSYLAERGGDVTSPELRIHATVPAGARAVVAVSEDGSTYEDLGVLDESTTELDLARAELTTARFVRITDEGVGGIQIDAFEALR